MITTYLVVRLLFQHTCEWSIDQLPAKEMIITLKKDDLWFLDNILIKKIVTHDL